MRSHPMLGALLALLLGACAQAPAADGAGLDAALSRVDGPFPGYLEFVDQGAAADWRLGGLDAERQSLSDVLGIDLAAADAVLVAGQPPHKVTLVLGGQDEDGIRTRAESGGWASADGALRRELDLREPLTLPRAPSARSAPTSPSAARPRPSGSWTDPAAMSPTSPRCDR
ncbi:hypothetical protein BJF90_30165 [Pseudonocardia sp. CNS-004]|nr:hypothetical protein BJF90_30165 [Pseudonocardia sp. CNS-004]